MASVVDRLELRPVFTAHPTEASRRTVLELLVRVATTIDDLEDPRSRPADAARGQRTLAELVDMLWQTDELRIERPEPADEARSALYYLTSLATGTVPDLLEDLDAALEGIGVVRDRTSRPLRFGSWVGGDRDGNPNVTPTVTLDVLALMHERGLSALVTLVDDLTVQLTASVKVVGVSRKPVDLARGRPRGDARGARHRRASERRGALPAQAQLRAHPADQHPRAHRPLPAHRRGRGQRAGHHVRPPLPAGGQPGADRRLAAGQRRRPGR